jgi:sterol desaturase/sphingolipid hydroxylase (fatty acid hydroxylase superfamily)
VNAPILSSALIVLAALTFMALERRYPYTPGQRFIRQGFWMDLVLYSLVQNWVLGKIIELIIHGLDVQAAGRLHLVGGWPLPLQAVFFLVVHDIYIYWFHRLQHRVPFLWRIHEAHHSTPHVDWLSGTRSHSLEILINQTIEFAPLFLLGAPPEIGYFKVTIDAIWGMYIHSNINVRSGWLQKIFNGPEMHRWHHALEVVNVNFSTKIAIWDWIFGTAYLPGTKPKQYGLEPTYAYPVDSYIWQHLIVFFRRRPTTTA